MTKSEVEMALDSAITTVPKNYEERFTPEFALTGEAQEIHWMTDVLGENDAESDVFYQAFYHYQNDASGLVPTYKVDNELTRTETILVNTEDEPIPGGVLQIIDKDGNVVDSWSTTEQNHVTLGLTEGETYTIHQVSTVYPYRVAQDDEFEVLIGETTYVKVINDKAKDLSIKKLVEGGFWPNEEFNFTLNVTNAMPNAEHIVETPSGNQTFTTDSTGAGTFSFVLKHNETVKVLGLKSGATAIVTERSNNYQASYSINNGAKTTNPSPNMNLAASITMGDNNANVQFENKRIIPVPTGVQSAKKFIAMLLIVEALILLFVRKKKK
jgi:hypothetical protein